MNAEYLVVGDDYKESPNIKQVIHVVTVSDCTHHTWSNIHINHSLCYPRTAQVYLTGTKPVNTKENTGGRLKARKKNSR